MPDSEKKSYKVSTSKLLRTSFALDGSTARQVHELRAAHNAGSITNYIKGLIALDWMDTKKEPLDVTKAPTWIIPAYKLDVRESKIQPRTVKKA